jgi:hypothetical protein
VRLLCAAPPRNRRVGTAIFTRTSDSGSGPEGIRSCGCPLSGDVNQPRLALHRHTTRSLSPAVSEIENQRISSTPDFAVVPAADTTQPASAISQSRHSHQRLHRIIGRPTALARLWKGQRPYVEKSLGGSVAVCYQTFCSRETALPKDRRTRTLSPRWGASKYHQWAIWRKIPSLKYRERLNRGESWRHCRK